MGVVQSSYKKSKKSLKLLPGTLFPSIIIKLVTRNDDDDEEAKEEDLSLITTNKDKLIVIYRGAFCPFCKNTLATLQSKLDLLDSTQIDLIVISADTYDIAKESSILHVS